MMFTDLVREGLAAGWPSDVPATAHPPAPQEDPALPPRRSIPRPMAVQGASGRKRAVQPWPAGRAIVRPMPLALPGGVPLAKHTHGGEDQQPPTSTPMATHGQHGAVTFASASGGRRHRQPVQGGPECQAAPTPSQVTEQTAALPVRKASRWPQHATPNAAGGGYGHICLHVGRGAHRATQRLRLPNTRAPACSKGTPGGQSTERRTRPIAQEILGTAAAADLRHQLQQQTPPTQKQHKETVPMG